MRALRLAIAVERGQLQRQYLFIEIFLTKKLAERF